MPVSLYLLSVKLHIFWNISYWGRVCCGHCITEKRWMKTSGLPAFPAASAAWLFGTFYAVTDEVHQMLVPGRSGECRDVLIDSAGVLAGILLVIIVFKIKNRKEVKG
ncbi:MAG: VanZ family protein [Firmicutes bacterium]|nr:VanZ family protein [Bacillota bacterium]